MDRTDIDALLIGALYGELTPADEARLTTHLESHPADRGALADLKVARQAVVDSRIFAVQLDPPQAVSALLLQEAHRRAPKRVVASDAPESWFARFTRNFMAHPAMAAAAMLVLVLGGAGLMYSRNGDQTSAKQATQSSTSEATGQVEADRLVVAAEPAAAAPAQGSAAVADGSAINAQLYEGGDQVKGQALADEKSAAGRWEEQSKLAKAESRGRADAKQKAPSRAMTVTTERAPKDFESKSDRDDAFALDAKPKAPANKSGAGTSSGAVAIGGGGASYDYGATNAISGAGAPGGSPNAGYAQPPPPPAPVTTKSAGPATATAPPVAPQAPAANAPKPAPEAKESIAKSAAKPTDTAATAAPAKQDALLAWAKAEHSRAVSLAKNGNCDGAAKIALSVSTRATSYYSQHMATDRALKSCAQYITAERDKEAERQKARARVNASEPAPTTTK